jgi:protein required for attachment to host cells
MPASSQTAFGWLWTSRSASFHVALDAIWAAVLLTAALRVKKVEWETLMLLPHGAVIAIVDGEKFELYRNSGNEAAPDLSPVKAPKLDEHNRDSGARHISSSANPGHLLAEDSHIAAVVSWLNRQATGGEIKHLVIVAPARTLGEMRRRYDKQLEAVLLGELHKELIGRSGGDILTALQVN